MSNRGGDGSSDALVACARIGQRGNGVHKVLIPRRESVHEFRLKPFDLDGRVVPAYTLPEIE